MKHEQPHRPCPCDSGFPFAACCAPFLAGLGTPPTALATMRSRYSANALGHLEHLRDTWHPRTRPQRIAPDPDRRWIGLAIKGTTAGEAGDTEGTVEFVARFKIGGRGHRMHEISRFVFENGRWLYVDGEVS